jgi:hypothetical protein
VRRDHAAAFMKLKKEIRAIDRDEQRSLVESALKQAVRWKKERGPTAADHQMWKKTVIDLHATSADRLDLFITKLEAELKKKAAPSGIQRIKRWPNRNLSLPDREKELIHELTYRLTDDYNVEAIKEIVDRMNSLGGRSRIVFVDIDGPCTADDGPLVSTMLDFWQKLLTETLSRAVKRPHLPLLLVGHVDPEPPSGAPMSIDTTTFYHASALDTTHERRLSLIYGHHLYGWLDEVVPADRYDARYALEEEIARGLGARLIEDIPGTRMKCIIDLIWSRAGPS